MKTSELAGSSLDHWVAKAEGLIPEFKAHDGQQWVSVRELGMPFMPSHHWGQGGPIIDREGIAISPMSAKGGSWCAISMGRLPVRASGGTGVWVEGPTPLIAAMRAYVRAKFGPEVE